VKTRFALRFLFGLALLLGLDAYAGDSTRLYNPYADAAKDVAQLLPKAKAEHKRILLQVGGNWCVMCYRLNALIKMDTVLKKLVDENYIVYHLNYSTKNKNLMYLKTIGSPQRFGFPVLVVLDSDGKRLYTQESGALQKGNGYSVDKVKVFLEQWRIESGERRIE
jgi:thioredoxin-related protein